MIVTFEKVTTWPQTQELRQLRNECRDQMTRDTAEIGLGQQSRFYEDQILSGRVTAVLARREGRAVAYGVLWPGGTWPAPDELWLSCGVSATARGKGLGIAIVRYVTALAGSFPVKLEVWQDNAVARAVYEKAGFAVTGSGIRDGRTFELMEHR